MTVSVNTNTTVATLNLALNTAISAIPLNGTAEEAYKAFMDKLGQGFTQAIGDALGAALGAVQDHANSAAVADPRLNLIIELLQSGAAAKLDFSTPSLTVPLTQKISAKQGVISSATNSNATGGRVNILGGSVGVTGSYSF